MKGTYLPGYKGDRPIRGIENMSARIIGLGAPADDFVHGHGNYSDKRATAADLMVRCGVTGSPGFLPRALQASLQLRRGTVIVGSAAAG